MAQEKFYFKSTTGSLKVPDFDPVSVAMDDMRKRAINAVYGYGASRVAFDEDHPAPEEEKEEWVWVEGYKGTDRFMRCRDYQFSLREQFDMPEGEPIIECQSGFHLCPSLSRVFAFYAIADSNRFFRVRALVRKRDADKLNMLYNQDKLVAKSIVFLSELTTDEIFKDAYINTEGWTDKDKIEAREEGCTTIDRRVKTRTLIGLGYSESVAEYIVDHNQFLLAKMLGQQTDISMDTKFICLFNGL